ncbi:hypothetical protein G5714_002858 [Onychostoma macrolepis]|uniref:Uncharacterized protein n=1 Tax=Onychostoma macrolepis TaxID=369639 RepID=A0A7J6D7U8_9TELE|nr:hypothetical protein G5714_002858 [Onychostoma macrolepis]
MLGEPAREVVEEFRDSKLQDRAPSRKLEKICTVIAHPFLGFLDEQQRKLTPGLCGRVCVKVNGVKAHRIQGPDVNLQSILICRSSGGHVLQGNNKTFVSLVLLCRFERLDKQFFNDSAESKALCGLQESTPEMFNTRTEELVLHLFARFCPLSLL